MKHLSLIAVTLILLSFYFSSCKKCYDCTKKCGTCTKGLHTVAGCQGDTILNGLSVEAWKAYFENQGYTCSYNNAMQSICGKDNKNELSSKFYECISK
ncbi:MAG: hypothetical protein KIS94_14830 [Chitinophagales bacterium]|nr:hypothetical protein [Chitinophagales bacterium]